MTVNEIIEKVRKDLRKTTNERNFTKKAVAYLNEALKDQEHDILVRELAKAIADKILAERFGMRW